MDICCECANLFVFSKQMCRRCYEKKWKNEKWERIKNDLVKIKCKCSPDCKTMIYPINKVGQPVHYAKNHGLKLELNPNWKNGRANHSLKYILVRCPNHPFIDGRGYIFEHRLVMEKHLGRYLTEEEVIHHIDGNPKNNDISNLMLFASHSEHLIYERTKDMSGRKCRDPECKDPFYKTIKKRKYIQWYGNEKDGWLCRRCYQKYRRQKRRLIFSLPQI